MENSSTDILNNFEDWHRSQKKRIAVGLLKEHPTTLESLRSVRDEIDIVIVGPTVVDGFECVETDNPEVLVRLAYEKEVDGVFRGNFDAVKLYNAIHKITGYSGPINTICLILLEKINSINENSKFLFTTTPTSASNDRNLAQKIANIDSNIAFYESLGIKPRIGFLSAGKPSDILEGLLHVDKTLVEAEFLLNWYAKKGYVAKHFNHQIEYAVQESEVLVFPDSISCNQASRGMLFFGYASFVGTVATDLPITYSQVPEAFRDWSKVLRFLNGYLNRPQGK